MALDLKDLIKIGFSKVKDKGRLNINNIDNVEEFEELDREWFFSYFNNLNNIFIFFTWNIILPRIKCHHKNIIFMTWNFIYGNSSINKVSSHNLFIISLFFNPQVFNV